jgi:hypothetical protein
MKTSQSEFSVDDGDSASRIPTSKSSLGATILEDNEKN